MSQRAQLNTEPTRKVTATPSEADPECLDANNIAALLDGSLAGAPRRAAEVHVDGCPACRELIAGLAVRVSSMHATHDDTRRALQQHAKSWVSTMRSEPTTAQRLLEQGEMIEHLCIEQLIGRGGMGEVYLARDTRLDRPVAVKIVSHLHLDTNRTREHFMTEARTTARLNHPNIVTVHTVGEHDGRPYLALEYIRGKTLRRWLGDDELDRVAAGLPIALSIVEALVEAHRHGVFHRDLKPENVLIGDDGRVRVVDFGLALTAELADESSGESALFTGVAGTPRYMAPEQWSSAPLDGAVDIWALGVMLYELVTDGRHPCVHDGDATTVELAAAATSHTEPIIPLPEDCPAALRRLIMRCLARTASARPSVLQVRDELRGLVEPKRAATAGWIKLALAMAAGAALVGGAVWLSAGGGAAAVPIRARVPESAHPLGRASVATQPPTSVAPSASASSEMRRPPAPARSSTRHVMPPGPGVRDDWLRDF